MVMGRSVQVFEALKGLCGFAGPSGRALAQRDSAGSRTRENVSRAHNLHKSRPGGLMARLAGAGTLFGVLFFAAAANAQDAAESALDTGDTAWIIIATILVVAMIIPGLGLFYGGLV